MNHPFLRREPLRGRGTPGRARCAQLAPGGESRMRTCYPGAGAARRSSAPDGRQMRTHAPPSGPLPISTRPPCAPAIASTMARPSPALTRPRRRGRIGRRRGRAGRAGNPGRRRGLRSSPSPGPARPRRRPGTACVPGRVLDQVRDRPLERERRRPARTHPHRRAARSVRPDGSGSTSSTARSATVRRGRPAPRTAARRPGYERARAGWWPGGRAARSPPAPNASAARASPSRVVVAGLHRGELDLGAGDRDRGAELVARVVEEGVLVVDRVLDAGQHRVETPDELGDLLGGRAPTGVARVAASRRRRPRSTIERTGRSAAPASTQPAAITTGREDRQADREVGHELVLGALQRVERRTDDDDEPLTPRPSPCRRAGGPRSHGSETVCSIVCWCRVAAASCRFGRARESVEQRLGRRVDDVALLVDAPGRRPRCGG